MKFSSNRDRIFETGVTFKYLKTVIIDELKVSEPDIAKDLLEPGIILNTPKIN